MLRPLAEGQEPARCRVAAVCQDLARSMPQLQLWGIFFGLGASGQAED